MRYERLGRSGLMVSQLIVGSTMFGELMDEGQARVVLHRAWDLGANTVDTANIYAGGRSEEIVGRIIADRRDQVVLCTKVGFRVGDLPVDHAKIAAGTIDHAERWSRGIAPHDQGLSRRHIVSAVERSLQRLGTDYIDLYQLHRWDPAVPIEETLRALEELVTSGKVRYIGCSNARSWQLYAGLWASDRCDLARFVSMQMPYSLIGREAEADVLPACHHADVSVIAYSALAGGALSGAHDAGVKPGTVLAQRPGYQAKLSASRERLERFAAYAAEHGYERTTLALAGVLAHPAVTAATIGVQHPAELDALVTAVDQPLEPNLYDGLMAAMN